MKFSRRFAFVLALLMIFLSCLPVFAEDEPYENPGITSGNAAVAYCIDDDQFLYADRIDERVAPTVAAKLVTTMVVADILKERGLTSSDTMVTVTQTAIDNSGDIADIRVPMMGLRAGSSYTCKDLLSATLVACANDAAASLADYFGETYLGGGIAEFVDRMNQKIADLGLTETHFVNPTGINASNQYSTPREVALIAAAFYNYNELVSLSNVESFLFNGRSTVRNKNYLKSNYYVTGFLNKNAIGLIAGQLDKKGNYCLITASQKEGRTYIFVVMCASGMIVETEDDKTTYYFGEGNAYDDINKLINWTRNSFELITIATTETIIGELRVNLGSSSDHVMIVPAEDIEKLVLNIDGVVLEKSLVYDPALVYKQEFNDVEYDTIDAPVAYGQRVGTITYSYNGIELATVDAVAKESVESDTVKASLNMAKEFLFGDFMKTVLYVIGGIIVAYFVIAFIMAIVRFVNKIRKLGPSNDKNSKSKNKTSAKKPKNGKKKNKTKTPSSADPNMSTREMG